jgi:hypothetical protein
MEQSPSWEAKSHTTSQEILRLLWNPKIHYHVHNSPPLVPILSHAHPVHNFPPYISKIHFNIILPSTPTSFNWSLPFRFPNESTACISQLSHPCYMPHPSYPPAFDHPNKIWWSVQVMKLLIMQSSPTTSSLLGTNILLSTLFSDTLNPCFP